MYRYEFVEIQSGFIFDSNTEYRKTIQRYAEKGWRYVGYMPRKYTGVIPTTFDLLFEQDCDTEI